MVLIWDLDNTLYRITPELADQLDAAMAAALVEDLGVPLDFETAKEQGLIFTNKLSTPYISNAQDVLFYDEVNQKWINIDSIMAVW